MLIKIISEYSFVMRYTILVFAFVTVTYSYNQVITELFIIYLLCIHHSLKSIHILIKLSLTIFIDNIYFKQYETL